MTHRITFALVPRRPNLRPDSYSVTHEGELLIATTHLPFYDGARALLAKGVTGPFEMWDEGTAPYPRMKGDIAEASRWTVWEFDTRDLEIRPWKPFTGAREIMDGVSDSLEP